MHDDVTHASELNLSAIVRHTLTAPRVYTHRRIAIPPMRFFSCKRTASDGVAPLLSQ